MALVTIQRSPSPSNDPDLDAAESSEDISDGRSQLRKRSKTSREKLRKIFSTVRFISKLRPCLSESYFTVKGAALILPHNECTKKTSKKSHGGEIQSHLQAMLHLLRPEDTIKIAVRLDDILAPYSRYMALVSTRGRQDTEEAVILGIDCTSNEAFIGLVLPVWMGLEIKLGGDGGFSLCTDEQAYLFKPVSVQAMWSAIQSLAKVIHVAGEMKYIQDGLTHTWVGYYRSRIDHSDVARLYQWNVEGVEVFAPSSLSLKSDDEDKGIKLAISQKLKEVMLTVDLDEATSIMLRRAVEEKLGKSLNEFKSYFDTEVMRILGQMDEPSQILDFLYLGSEWNASNLEELKGKGIGYILNVTKEIDNFFMGMFQYYNVRLYDVEESDLLKHWDKTFKFITKARNHRSKVLVHCKMGVSRSASTVMAYLMKDRRWSVEEAYDFVKERRSCVHPNSGFMEQLHMYEGILTASNKRDIFRCKSDQNLLDEGTKEEAEVTQGSFLGDSLFHMMSHSDWPIASGGVAREEEWIQSLDSDQVLASDMMQMDTDLETAESRSADSMEEALPDIPSPPPHEIQVAGSTTMPLTPPGEKTRFPAPSSDVEMKEPGPESEYGATRCSSESSERANSSLAPACSSTFNPRIRPDSSWIRLDSLDASSERDDSIKQVSENGTESLPFIDALPCDDICSNTQSADSSSHGAPDTARNEVVISQSDSAKPLHSVTEQNQSPSVISQSDSMKPLHSLAEQYRSPSATASVPSTAPHPFSTPLQTGLSCPNRSSAMGDGSSAQFYLGSQNQPPQNIPLIVVNSDAYLHQSIPLSSTMSGDSKTNQNLQNRGAMESLGQDQSVNGAVTDLSQSPTQRGHNPAACEKMLSDQLSPDKDPEKEEAPEADKPGSRKPAGKIEPGVREYFFREKIPWSPGKVKKIREDINKTGQISKDGEEQDEAEGKCMGEESPSDQEVTEEQALLDLMTEQRQTPGTLSQSRSCMELFTPGEGDPSQISLYEKEEIPLEPGTVLRTRLEIEERQRIFCGEGDQEVFGSSRPVLRTSSLKQERESPRSRHSDNRRLTCGPIMSPLGGKSLDDLRSVGASEVNLFETGPLSPEESGVKEADQKMNPADVTPSRLTMTTATSHSYTNFTCPVTPQRAQPRSLLSDVHQTRAFPLSETRTDDRKGVEEPSHHIDHDGSNSWRQQRAQGNFDSETLALIREIGSALLMSPTPPKPKDSLEEEPCTNMVKYFVRKIEKQTKSPETGRNIILNDGDFKEESHSFSGDLPGTSSSAGDVARKHSNRSSTGPQSLEYVDAWRDRNIGGMQESTVPQSSNKSLLKDSESSDCEFYRQGLRSTSFAEDSKHNNAPTTLSLIKRTLQGASTTENGMQQSGATEENGDNPSYPHGSSASTPRTPSHLGGSDSGEASVVRHLLGKFETQSPKTEKVSSDFGHDYTHKVKDSDGHPICSPSTPQKSMQKEDSYSYLSSSDEKALQPCGMPSSLPYCRSQDTQLSPQFSSSVISPPFDPSASLKSPSPSLSSSSFTSSPFMPLSHRRQTSLDSFQLSASPKPKRSPLDCDIAVELYELPAKGSASASSLRGEKSPGIGSFDSCPGTPKQRPTPFSKHSMEISHGKAWRSVRPKSADQVQRSASTSDYDSEPSETISEFHSGGRMRDRYNTFSERSNTFDVDTDANLRQVSEEGRKIRRLHGKSHPLTKLSEKRLGKGPFYSSM